MESNKPTTRIPRNPQPDFEIVSGFTGKDLLFISPSFVIDAAVIHFSSSLAGGIVASGFITLGFAALRTIHPVREDVPYWKHIYWMMRYMFGQKEFRYRKEITHSEHIQSRKEAKKPDAASGTVQPRSYEC